MVMLVYNCLGWRDSERAGGVIATFEQLMTADELLRLPAGAPDLVVEIIARHDLYIEVEEKVIAWLDAGARMVVVVNPCKRTVTVYRSLSEIVILTERDTLDGADVVPE